MEKNELQRAIKTGTLRGVYLLDGEEEYSKQCSLKDIEKAILPEGLEDLNETVTESYDTDEIMAAAETLPFAGEKRIVVVRNHPALIGNTRDADDKLIEYIEKVPSTCILIFYCTGKANGTKKLYKGIKKFGNVVTFSPFSDTDLTGFVKNQFSMLGKTCSDITAENLIFTVGSDMATIVSEVSKIASSVGDKSDITVADVDKIATKSTESKVFDMVDNVVMGKEKEAFVDLRNMLTSGEQRMGILAMLLRQYRMLQQVKLLQINNKHLSPYDAANHLGVKSFAAGKYIKQAAQYSPSQVKYAVNTLLDTEFKIKSGAINDAGGLESAMLKLFSIKHIQ